MRWKTQCKEEGQYEERGREWRVGNKAEANMQSWFKTAANGQNE